MKKTFCLVMLLACVCFVLILTDAPQVQTAEKPGFSGFAKENPFSSVLARATSAGGKWTLETKTAVYFMIYRPGKIVLVSKMVGDIMRGIYFRPDVSRYFWETANAKTKENLKFVEVEPESAQEICREFLEEIEKILRGMEEKATT